MQDLLAKRFHLASHWETKEIPVYGLAIGKDGPKFKESPVEFEETANAPGSRREVEAPRPKTGANGYPELPPEFSGTTFRSTPTGTARARLQVLHASIGTFVDAVAIRLDRPVVDANGLTDSYDFSIYWEEDDVPSGTPPTGVAADPAAAASQTVRGPSLKEAIEEQLGLKLVPGKAPVSVLNIDHLDSSRTEN